MAAHFAKFAKLSKQDLQSPSWRDLAYFAKTPEMAKRGGGRPSGPLGNKPRNRIGEFRERACMSQSVFARRLGLNPDEPGVISTISRWERSKADVPSEMVRRIPGVLDASIEEIFPEPIPYDLHGSEIEIIEKIREISTSNRSRPHLARETAPQAGPNAVEPQKRARRRA